MYTVYKITNLVNGKIYIGCTKRELMKRWSDHWNSKFSLKRTFLSSALIKYGKEAFKIEVIDYLSLEKDMYEKEKYWISLYKSNNPEIGYNMTEGGDRGPIKKGEDHCLYGKHPILPALLKSNQNRKGKTMVQYFGKERAAEIIEKVRQGNLGKKQSEKCIEMLKNRIMSTQTRMKLSIANTGKIHSKETKDKISKSKTGVASKKRQLIICITNNKVYDSHEDAAKRLKLNRSKVTCVVNGTRRQTGGFVFQKLTEEHLIF